MALDAGLETLTALLDFGNINEAQLRSLVPVLPTAWKPVDEFERLDHYALLAWQCGLGIIPDDPVAKAELTLY